MTTLFRDRVQAGQLLGEAVSKYANRHDVLVLGLPRGGIPVAFEVAKALNAPLDVFIVRKLGVRGYPELAMGAIATGGVRVLNEEVVKSLRIPDQDIEAVAEEEGRELKRRELAYRGHGASPEIRDRTVILIDDGVATGSTMRAAVHALRKQSPARLVVAVPTAAPSTYHHLSREVDEMVALMTPEDFHAVGQWYEDFSQTTDAEVSHLLEQAHHESNSQG